MSKPSYISRSQTVYYFFPNAFYNQPNAVVQVRYIKNNVETPNLHLIRHVLEQIAARMTADLSILNIHLNEAQRRRQNRQQNQQESTEETETENYFEEIFDDNDLIEILTDEVDSLNLPTNVRPEALEFVLVDSNTSVRTRIFPRSFHCRNCGHYIAIDPDKPPHTLECPCCQTGRIRQEPIIFGCARCGSVSELTPPGEYTEGNTKFRKGGKFDDFLGKHPSCPDCDNGHIHLEKHGTNLIQKWQWICINCDFCEDVAAFCLNCVLPKTDVDRTDIIPMRPFPATATGAFVPLIDRQTFVEQKPIDPSSLHTIAQQGRNIWTDYFELSTETTPQFLTRVLRLKDACVQDAYLLKRMSVVTTVYGYRAGKIMQNQRSAVAEDKQFTNFFRDPERLVDYLCYGMISEGAALVIEFNTNELLSRLSHVYSPPMPIREYAEAIEHECSLISATALQDLVQPDSQYNLALFPALHAVEHALLTTAHRILGHDSLGSMLFFRHGIILLYERDELGRGGVVQLVNHGIGLADLIEAAADHVMGCAQGCLDSCPSCTYTQDVFCHYPLQEFNRSWLPPNALLSRNGASLILSSR